MPVPPVEFIPSDDATIKPSGGIGLCLSGGGYRAMIFHLGALWRLFETGLLQKVTRVSSVSGGSLTAGVLALKWNRLSLANTKLEEFVTQVVGPLRSLASETIDRESVLLGLTLPGRVSDRIASAYREHLFGNATLQELPDHPTFVINATNVQSGVLWRFMKPYMRDYRVGEVKSPDIPLATAVAASSAFPPVLSPVEIRIDPRKFTPATGLDLQREPFTSRIILTDGGVYDNLGLETIWKRCKTVLVSDGGGQTMAEEEPKTDWAQHSYRILNMIDNQVRSLRKRQLIASYELPRDHIYSRDGAYWSIRSNITNFQLSDSLPCPLERTIELARVPTRLKRIDGPVQERLINWGYAVCDAAIRRHLDPNIPRPTSFPYKIGV